MVKRVLIVEDSLVQAAQYQIVFAKFKSRIFTKGKDDDDLLLVIVEDAKQALTKLKQLTNFVLIITDVNMPEIDGIEFLHIVKDQKLADCPKIVLSTPENSQRMEEAKKRGLVSEFVIKPWNIKKIQEMIIRLVPDLI